MMAEYGLIPEIFNTATYSSAEVCSLQLCRLKEALLEHGLVRDFRDGEWREYLGGQTERLDLRARELLKKLITQKRLVPAPPAAERTPTSESEWCEEALASHHVAQLTGIIAGRKTALAYTSEDVVRSIDRLDTAEWWTRNRDSLLLARTTSEYLRHLNLALRHANFLMFIDPHVDPRQRRYREFIRLLLAARRPEGRPGPRIEIHRQSSGDGRHGVLPLEHWRSAFGDLQPHWQTRGLRQKYFSGTTCMIDFLSVICSAFKWEMASMYPRIHIV
jgi:hypothetical protein